MNKFFLFFLLLNLNSLMIESKINSKIDSELISCDICLEIINELNNKIKQKRNEIKKKVLEEEFIHDLIGSICQNNKPNGEWIRKLDIKNKKKICLS